MKPCLVLLGIVGVFSFLLLVPCVPAGECDYGVASAWFCRLGAGWVNATAHPRLSRGVVFRVRVEVVAFMPLQVFFVKLHEFGTPVFEVLDGPTRMEQLLECREQISADQRFSFTWTMRVRPETTWVAGYAPLEVLVQFNTHDGLACQVDFDVLTAYILDDDGGQQPITRPTASEPGARGSMPGFTGGEVLLAVTLFVVVWKKR
jgi:sarcinarray family protein